MDIHCFAKVSEEEIEEAFFYPSDLVNTKTTIPSGSVMSGGYVPRREVSRYISTTIHLPFGELYIIQLSPNCNYEFLFPKLNIKKKNKTTKGLSIIVLLRPPCSYACALESHLYCLASYIRRLCNAQYLGSHGSLKYPHLIAERWLRGKEISKKSSMTKDTSVADNVAADS